MADAAVTQLHNTTARDDARARGGWTQAEAAKRHNVMQPRMNGLLRGRIFLFSLDALVNIAAALGRKMHVELKVA